MYMYTSCCYAPITECIRVLCQTRRSTMSEELEDAVTFLEEARGIFPDVTSLLNTNQVLALDMDPKDPFQEDTVNEQFVKLAEAYFVTKHNVDQAKYALRISLMEPHAKDKEVDVAAEEKVIKCMEKVRTP